MDHIERGDCATLSMDRIENHRARKEMVALFLDDPEQYRAEHRDGGVRLDAEYDTDRAPGLPKHGGIPVGDSDASAWPQLPATGTEAHGPVPTSSDKVEIPEPGPSWDDPASTLLFPVVKVGPRMMKDEALEPIKPELDPTSNAFNQERFRNPVTLMYSCPHPGCL